MAVEIVIERLGKPPVKVRGTNLIPVDIGDRLTARSINGVRRMWVSPITVISTPLIIDLQSIREALAEQRKRGVR